MSDIHKVTFKSKIFLCSSGRIVTMYNSDFLLMVCARQSLKCCVAVTEGVHSGTFIRGTIVDTVWSGIWTCDLSDQVKDLSLRLWNHQDQHKHDLHGLLKWPVSFISDAFSVHSIHTLYQLCWSRLAWFRTGGSQNTQAINFSTSTYIALWSFHGIYCTVVFCAYMTSEQMAWRAWKWKTSFFQRPVSARLRLEHSHLQYTVPVFLPGDHLIQCFSTAGSRPCTGPWHQLYRAAIGSPGICQFSFPIIFHE